MQISYVVDRFEDGGWAVLEDPAGLSFPVPRDWLPAASAEGDVILVSRPHGEADGAGASIRFDLDPAARAKRLANIAAIRDRLQRGASGDLEL